MVRRQKSNAADVGEAFVALVARLPWWAALGIGLVAYLVLHSFAHPPVVSVTRLDQMAGVMAGSLVYTGATIFQYVIPGLCVMAAFVSAVGRRKRVDLVSGVVSSNAPSALNDMTWADFELLVGEGFRLQGFQVEERGGAGPDGGVDLIVRRDGEKYVVQCKQWKNLKVSVPVVRELFGVMAATGAAGGYVVTSGRFTDEANAFAEGRNIHLINGSKLTGMLRQARSARQRPPATPSLPVVQARVKPVSPVRAPALTCPDCSGPMVNKRAKRGPNAGGTFWSCATYPTCKGTRPA